MAWSDIQTTLLGFGGDSVTVSAHNPQSHAETARVRVVVTLDGGSQQTLTSPNFTLQPQETRTVHLSASGAIVSITEGPVPIEPLG